MTLYWAITQMCVGFFIVGFLAGRFIYKDKK